jgi:hypothetical protein
MISESSDTSATSDIEQDVSSAIEDQLDDFFGIDDAEKDQSSSDLFADMDFSDDEALTPVEPALETEEEEVVFELVEELSFSDGEVEAPATVAALSAFDEAPESSDAIAAISDEIFTEIDNVLPDNAKAIVSDGLYSFERLGSCVEAIGLELEDKVMYSLLAEIKSAQQQYSDEPLEKTFLYLLKTLASHINHFRYEAGSDAYVLLKSVYEALLLSQTAVDERQELLLAQTAKVLDWQQDVIMNGGRKDSDHAASSAPLFVQEIGSSHDDVITFDDDLFSDSSHTDDSGTSQSSRTTGDLKDEISSLRKSLQDEISELKKGLSDD